MAEDQATGLSYPGERRAPRATVVGAGTWGTVFATVLADAGSRVALLARDPAVVEEVMARHTNERYLPGVTLPGSVDATQDPVAALDGADVVAVALPCQSARDALSNLRNRVPPGAVVVSLMKGIETTTGARMSAVVSATLGVPPGRVAVLSGPNLSLEIAARQPTATVVASTDRRTARLVAHACATDYFRPYTNDDVVGIEICGAAKNVVALAVGMALGRGYGQNTIATLVTRGLAEITRLGAALGAHPATFAGLAGLGDLIATCTSPRSRNHGLGRLIGTGVPLDEAVARTRTTAEGVETCRSLLATARAHDVAMPVAAGVVDVLYHGGAVDDVVHGVARRRTGRPGARTQPV